MQNILIARLPTSLKNARTISGLIFLSGGLIFLLLGLLPISRLEPGVHPNLDMWARVNLGFGLFLIGGWLITPAPPRTLPRATPLQMALLIGVLGLALFLRVYQHAQVPLGIWFDESVSGNIAVRMWENANYQPIFIDNITYYHLKLHQLGITLFGRSTLAIRFPSIVFGVLAVLAAYRLGKEIRDPWFGLGMAFFVAVPFWAINFSRIGMTGIDVLFFSLLASVYAVRMVRHQGAWRDVFWLAVILGAGLWFYTAFRFVGVALMLYVLTRIRFWRWYWIQRGLVVGAVVLVAVSPILLFARTNPDRYLERSRQVVITNHLSGRPLMDVLERSTESYLKMFTIRGDANGRHNVPRAPMLDRIMGALFVLGLFTAWRHLRKPEGLLFYFLLVMALITGISTLPSEAPNALRAMAALGAVAYFCTVVLYDATRLLPRLSTRLTEPVMVTVVLVLVAVLGLNYQQYFLEFKSNATSFSMFSTPHTVRGYLAQERIEQGFITRTPNRILSENSQLFIAPTMRTEPNGILMMPHPFPLEPVGDATLSVILDPIFNQWVWDYARAFYPNATYTAPRPTDYGAVGNAPLAYAIDITPAELAASPGLQPDGSGGLYTPAYGAYRFYASFGEVQVNNTVLTPETTLTLAQGHHRIQLESGAAELYWWTPDSDGWEPVPGPHLHQQARLADQGFVGRFYPGDIDLAQPPDSPTVIRLDPTLYSYFHLPPLPRPYSAIWSADVVAPQDGRYIFHLYAVGYIELWLNGEQLMAQQTPDRPVEVNLTAGRHRLELRFIDNTGGSGVYLRWLPPGAQEYTPIPPQNLIPAYG
ncbi:MAG: hypothetical protein OHK0046_34950 [Anaerolineae bacterium]